MARPKTEWVTAGIEIIDRLIDDGKNYISREEFRRKAGIPKKHPEADADPAVTTGWQVMNRLRRRKQAPVLMASDRIQDQAAGRVEGWFIGSHPNLAAKLVRDRITRVRQGVILIDKLCTGVDLKLLPRKEIRAFAKETYLLVESMIDRMDDGGPPNSKLLLPGPKDSK